METENERQRKITEIKGGKRQDGKWRKKEG